VIGVPELKYLKLFAEVVEFFKDNELYRIAIQFYNKFGQYSPPKWIADFKAMQTNVYNIEGYYAMIRISFTSNFYTWLISDNNFLYEPESL